MRWVLRTTYGYFVTLPERLYPFKSEIQGNFVRGRRSYELALRRAARAYGKGRLGYKLMMYRQAFHFVGSILFITFSTLISKDLFGSDTALYVLLGSAIVALAYQEFYLHPKTFGQLMRKGVTDYLVWVVPMIVYILR